MTTSVYPETWGDLILDLRYIISDGVLRPAVVAVDKNGKQLSQGRIVEVRDGGGHVELFRFIIADTIGFDQLDSHEVKIHPEGV
jgi:hypothetical protein